MLCPLSGGLGGKSKSGGGLAVSGMSLCVAWRCCLVLEGLCGFMSVLACPQLTELLPAPFWSLPRSFASGRWELGNNLQAAFFQISQDVPGQNPKPLSDWVQQNASARNRFSLVEQNQRLFQSSSLCFCFRPPQRLGARDKLGARDELWSKDGRALAVPRL